MTRNARQTNAKAPPSDERPIQVPSKPTLRKYGLDAQSWLAILESQNWVCAICKKVPKTGRFIVDHFHAPKWKQMAPEKRRAFVRGITCWWCNKTFLGRGITEAKAMSVAIYLRAFAIKMAWAAYDKSKAET